MSRLRSLPVIVGLLVASLPSSAWAQLAGRHAGGADFAPIDASALGDTRPASIAVFTAAAGVGLGAGWGLDGGAIRGYLSSNGDRVSFGGSFARTLGERRLARALIGTIGGDLVGGYGHVFDRTPDDVGELRLSVPLGLSIGDPSGTSFGLYAAPYAEAGVGRRLELAPGGCDPFCRHVLGGRSLLGALGTSVGMRGSFRRFSVELMMGDVYGLSSRSRPSDGALALTYRLGAGEVR